jgi:hypothetical protein
MWKDGLKQRTRVKGRKKEKTRNGTELHYCMSTAMDRKSETSYLWAKEQNVFNLHSPFCKKKKKSWHMASPYCTMSVNLPNPEQLLKA